MTDLSGPNEFHVRGKHFLAVQKSEHYRVESCLRKGVLFKLAGTNEAGVSFWSAFKECPDRGARHSQSVSVSHIITRAAWTQALERARKR